MQILLLMGLARPVQKWDKKKKKKQKETKRNKKKQKEQKETNRNKKRENRQRHTPTLRPLMTDCVTRLSGPLLVSSSPETMDWLGHMWADDAHGIPPDHMTLVLGHQRTAHAL